MTNSEIMELALRVLMAITEHREPESADEEQLRRLAPAYADCQVDGLARAVVWQASKDLQKSWRGH